MKPLIGITADVDDGSRFAKRYSGKKILHMWSAYFEAITDSGAAAVLLAPGKPEDIGLILSRLDGILLSGTASDVPPSFYGEKTIKAAKVKPNSERGKFERDLILKAIQRGLPILGICGGEQILNVALGGSLYQDVRLQVGKKVSHESSSSKNPAMHEVEIEPCTLLSRLLFPGRSKKPNRLMVNSYHHQAIKKPGKGLKVSAICKADGVIEAVEAEKGFVLGVQWHPERMYKEKAEQSSLIRQFLRKASH
jgi:putative glutamine amidotransferase